MKRFLIALQFLTRVRAVKHTALTGDDLGLSAPYFPLVGFAIGLFLATLAFGGSMLFSPLTIAVLLVAGESIVTGGLHLDGYMDACDGLFSGRPREQILEIMKDSRVGSMGVIGLVILLSVKIALLSELPIGILIPVVAIMPLLGRWAMVFAIWRFPYARAEGLGGYFSGRMGVMTFFMVSLFCTASFLAVMPLKLYVTLLLTAAGTGFAGIRINRILGGHTGDVYGMLNEITETLFLLWCVLLYRL